jgi:sarcosine oxidase subunit gamma
MSNAVSALAGAGFDGFVTVQEAGLRGMITLRGDLASAKLSKAVTKVAGVAFPEVRGIVQNGERAIAWMSPDELLIMVPYTEVNNAVSALNKALSGSHVLVANVSDARAIFRIEGAASSEVLAKLTPFDVGSLAEGQIARSRAAQVAAAFWMTGPNAFELVSFRSTARYMWGLLKNAAMPGSEVGWKAE